MKDFIISAYGRSNVGKKRGNNEDNFYLSGVTVDSANDIIAKFNDSSKLATAVFDGMGGEAAGEKASQIAAVTFGENLSDIINTDFSEGAITSTIESANKKVCDEIRKMGKRMGCTFVSLGFSNNTIHIANVGDSRAYLLRDAKLYCISKDHTVSQSMVDSGVISYEESQKIKEKHMLTQHLGIFPDEMLLEPYFNTFAAKENDIVLLCSDGLTDMLSDSEIQSVLQQQATPENATNVLVAKALENGGKDNITVIVAKISTENEVAPIVVKHSDHKRKLFVIGGSVSLVVLAIFICVFFLSKGDSDDKSKASSKDTYISIDTTNKKELLFNTSGDIGNRSDLSSDKSDETTTEVESEGEKIEIGSSEVLYTTSTKNEESTINNSGDIGNWGNLSSDKFSEITEGEATEKTTETSSSEIDVSNSNGFFENISSSESQEQKTDITTDEITGSF